MKNKTILSIIIPCFNAQKYIGHCLKSIRKSKFTDYEIIVVDDKSTDKSIQEIRNSKFKIRNGKLKFKIIENKKNLGPAISRNIGVRNSSGKYLLFLDADTEIEKNCLETIVVGLGKSKEIGAVQAKLIRGKSNKIDTAGHFLSYFGFPYEIGVGESENKHNKEKVIFGARSAGMGIRKDLFEKIKGFDEDYFIYGEDTDLSWRAWLAGYKILYLPQAKVHHFQKSSLTKKTKYRIFYEGAKNNTGNLLKNVPLNRLFWLLPLHILGWLFLSLKLISQARFQSAAWIYKGLGWNLKNLGRIWKKRKAVASYTAKNNQCSKIMFGEMNLKMFFVKGWRWFWHV